VKFERRNSMYLSNTFRTRAFTIFLIVAAFSAPYTGKISEHGENQSADADQDFIRHSVSMTSCVSADEVTYMEFSHYSRCYRRGLATAIASQTKGSSIWREPSAVERPLAFYPSNLLQESFLVSLHT